MFALRTIRSWLPALAALVGVGICLVAVGQFMMTVRRNELTPTRGEDAVRELYLTVGHSYSQGFVVGFFFCFSLAILAVVTASWWELRAERVRSGAPARR